MARWMVPWFNNDEIDRLFEEPFFGAKGMTFPMTDVYEKDGKVFMEFELPGFDEKDLDVSITDKMVIVRGESSEKKEQKDKKYYRMESRSQSVSRQMYWPVLIRESTAQAELKDGVLKVWADKTEEKKAKKLTVKKVGKK